MSVSLKAKIAEVFEEPGCDKNVGKSEKERKKGCTKQLTPGAAAYGISNDPGDRELPELETAAPTIKRGRGRPRKPRPSGSVHALRDPATGTIWSGRGRLPKGFDKATAVPLQ